ncbi:MAG: cytidine deaminase [Planctomycetes bacterium]|nr:cytidine deaminase [Planctomycetota bacterium]
MTLDPRLRDQLVAAAVAVRAHAYAPASHFHVGAAVLAADGRVFTGCNVENASYGLTICAERAAVCAAVAAGVRELRAVAVATGLDEPATPCGACRQVLAEFGPDMPIVLVGRGGQRRETTLPVLLPQPFRFADLARSQDRAGTDASS